MKRNQDATNSPVISKAKKQKSSQFNQSSCKVQPGNAGFFVTFVLNKENDSKKEAYAILNKYADLHYGPENADQNADESELSIEDAFKKEVVEIQRKKVRRFTCVDIGIPCCLFVRCIAQVDPVNLVYKIMEGENSCRYLQRIIPVTNSCTAEIGNIAKMAKTLIEPAFGGKKGLKVSWV